MAVQATLQDHEQTEQLRLLRGLALDGYVVSWNEGAREPMLRAALPGEVDLPACDDEVHQLLKQFGFAVPLGHLDQAIDAHARGYWAAANSQIRSFLEGLVVDADAKLTHGQVYFGVDSLPFHKTGKHRRVHFDDLMQFKSHRDQASEDAMAELAKQAQELALGYE